MILVTLKKAVSSSKFGITLFPGRHYNARQESYDRWVVYPSISEPVEILVPDKNILHVLDID